LILEQVFPESGTEVLFDSDHLADLYPKVDGLRFNFVIANGNDLDTSSDKSTNNLDRELLKFIRSQSDLIITTGKTARAENLAASRFAPMLILTTSQEDLEIAAVQANEEKPVYITQRLGNLYPSEKAIAIGGVQNNLPEFVDSFCRANNFRNVVLESGVETARTFASAGKVTEVDLTLTNFSSSLDVESSAKEFLGNIGFEGVLIQILKSDDTWFFRFGAV
jgi:DNA-binding LacI/PurR family transcriptional regulator